MSERARRSGRPTKPPTPGTRVSLGLKVTPEIKTLLDAAAQASGRTQSQEAERRLEQSFHSDSVARELTEIRSEIAGLRELLAPLGREPF